MIHDPSRLQQLFRKPALRPLMERLRARLRLGRRLDSPVALSDLSAQERSAIDHLLGRCPSSGSIMSIRPGEVERILREGRLCDSLQEGLIHVFGPIVNERHARELDRNRWTDLRTSIAFEFSNAPIYHPWLDRIFANGKLKRWSRRDTANAERLLRAGAAVLRGIPWPVIPLADLATRLTGDSHALDRGTPLSRLCLSAVESQRESVDGKAGRRQLWEWAGVVIDELSAPVLVLNLRGNPATLVGRMLNMLADAGEPCHLSIRLLRSAGAAAFDNLRGKVVHACENPSVVATAARRLGPTGRPLICTAGQPASAAQLLLSLLKQAGCRIFYHGDFDYAGIIIANLLIERFGVEPWRMTSCDYGALGANGPALKGKLVTASWDVDLAQLLKAQGHALLEESVLDLLLEDLSQSDDVDAWEFHTREPRNRA